MFGFRGAQNRAVNPQRIRFRVSRAGCTRSCCKFSTEAHSGIARRVEVEAAEGSSAEVWIAEQFWMG